MKVLKEGAVLNIESAIDVCKDYILYNDNGVWDVYDIAEHKNLEANYDTRVIFDYIMKRMIKEDEENIMIRSRKELETMFKQTDNFIMLDTL